MLIAWGLDWAIWHDIPHGGWCPTLNCGDHIVPRVVAQESFGGPDRLLCSESLGWRQFLGFGCQLRKRAPSYLLKTDRVR